MLTKILVLRGVEHTVAFLVQRKGKETMDWAIRSQATEGVFLYLYKTLYVEGPTTVRRTAQAEYTV
jgi:hypothetical protein